MPETFENARNKNTVHIILVFQNSPKFLKTFPGCGKSMSLAQIAHFCHDQGYIILNFRKIQDWFLRHQEVSLDKWSILDLCILLNSLLFGQNKLFLRCFTKLFY